MRQAQSEMLDYQGLGYSLMSLSHRSDAFRAVLGDAERDLRELLSIPDNYKVLFLSGGASSQFGMTALNFGRGFKRIDAVVTGNWSRIAYEEMGKLHATPVHLAAHGGELFDYKDLPNPKTWDVSPDSAFAHFALNETVHGLQYREPPKARPGMPPMVCDMSSELLSREINVSDYAMIYAGAQKNCGCAGTVIAIVRDDFVERCPDDVPDVWNYRSHVNKQGMYNTPATYSVYICGLVLRWLKSQGGVKAIEKLNARKAKLVYDAIDGSDGFYANGVNPDARSRMNVVFKTPTKELDDLFCAEASLRGLKSLKGYATLGGMRASLYNAMPYEGAKALAEFMADFAKRRG